MSGIDRSSNERDGGRPRRSAARFNEEEETISRRKRKRSAAMRPVKYNEDQSDEVNSEPEPEPKVPRPTKQPARATSTDDAPKPTYDREKEENHQRPTPIRIDMQYLAKGSKVKRHHFDNIASASRRTGVNADLLQGVCDDGGGFLGGFWFSYYENDLPKKDAEFFRPIKFEVSSLRPLKGEFRTGRWWERLVELECKKTEKAVVAFPSIEYAADALGIHVHQVRRACNSYGTGQQYDFDSYILRFKMESSFYVYGAHRIDFEKASESPEIKMPSDIVTTDIVTTTECATVDLKEIEAIDEIPEKEEEDKKESPDDDDSSEKRPQSLRETILNETMSFFRETFEASPKAPVQERNPRPCIFCQETPSEIIFEPCGHSLVCQRCATWSCRHFCPRCRMDISNRTKSTSVFRGIKLNLALMPLTFSPYSFMDMP